ncbi:hypothetical protein [Natronorubrum sp. DTA28]|uniref:hypothetical protein n=1 Tax=Natronorubrum sp. DTA28 TaxID=3447019 RepID=UPI003F85A165
MSVDQTTLDDYSGDNESPVEIDLPQLPPADDDGGRTRWRDHGVETYDSSEDAGISESGVVEIMSEALGSGVDDKVQNAFDVHEMCTLEERARHGVYSEDELERIDEQSGHGNNFCTE